MTQPTMSEHWRKLVPKDHTSIPLGPPHHAHNNTTTMQCQTKTHKIQTQINLRTVKWAQRGEKKLSPCNSLIHTIWGRCHYNSKRKLQWTWNHCKTIHWPQTSLVRDIQHRKKTLTNCTAHRKHIIMAKRVPVSYIWYGCKSNIIHCVQKKHPLLFSCIIFSQVNQCAQKFQCK